MATTINITACDNELLLIAYQGNASYIICDIKSGYGNAVDIQIPISAGSYQGPVQLDGIAGALTGTYPASLPAGGYTLTYAGLNWGGPTQFRFTLDGTPYSLPLNPPVNLNGVVWACSETIALTV